MTCADEEKQSRVNIIVVIYLALRKENSLMAFENRLLRRTFGD
jgi:hypothetical protein